MRLQKILAALVVSVSFATTSIAMAHVTVYPAEAALAAETIYTVRVPTEGNVTTTAVELMIPEGVTILSVDGAPGAYELKKSGGRTASIVWKTEIPPGQRAELTFIAKNPASGSEIGWKAIQIYQDSTRAEWAEAKGGKRPAPITTLTTAH